jgi:hypothetical protein
VLFVKIDEYREKKHGYVANMFLYQQMTEEGKINVI